ncbi:hypothetical protein SCHPADRAFT_872440 [Schizopora paradoxa]|uniref:Transcription initiation factor TFIID subunit 4 n=1 Tax=Schizopora paradoxa TaxID=27342 RepID=A0A0H2RYH2_9AGAM|nr:hypothetical protein SCHPADRAFT_872440 [Schizopora paradoxa]
MSTPAAKKVKLEHEGTPAPPSSTPTPAPTYTSQWSTGQIPIDPALQQQPPAAPTQHMMYPHYQTYGQASHHYASPYSHYQQYQPPQSIATPATAPAQTTTAAPTVAPVASVAPTPISRQPTQVQQQQPANNADTNDIATLNDALGSAGVDLRAEEEHLSRSQDHHTAYRSYEDRSRRQPSTPNFDVRNLHTRMTTIGKQHKVNRIPEDSVQYIALALRIRLQTLVTAMVEAATHRAEAQFDRTPALYDDQTTPMWSVVVRKDTRKILEVLEKIEREEEMKIRRERKQREEAAALAAAQAAAAASGMANGNPMDGDGANGEDIMMTPAAEGSSAKKSKKKKEGPGVAARNLSEDVQKRLSNAVATQAAGLSKGKYAWMNAGTVTSTAAKAKSTPAPAATSTSSTVANGTTATDPPSSPLTSKPLQPAATSLSSQTTSSWAKPYVSTSLRNVSPAAGTTQEDDKKVLLTLRDAMFVVDRERGHGGGRGAARGWV